LEIEIDEAKVDEAALALFVCNQPYGHRFRARSMSAIAWLHQLTLVPSTLSDPEEYPTDWRAHPAKEIRNCIRPASRAATEFRGPFSDAQWDRKTSD
jgi:hypothetical protein